MSGDVLDKALQRLADVSGQAFGIKTFENRLRTQKVVYLLQQMGMPELQRFGFTHYQHGPYSSDLTKRYYNEGMAISPRHKTPVPPQTDIERAMNEALNHGGPFLEAASMVVMINRYEHLHDETELLQRLYEVKPHTMSVGEDAVKWAKKTNLIFNWDSLKPAEI